MYHVKNFIFKRNPARFLSIPELLGGKIIEAAGVKIFLLDDVSISRVITVGTVLSSYHDRAQGFGSASIEDGKAVINARGWGPESALFKDITRGDTVILLGKVKEFNNERYLSILALRRIHDFNEEMYWRAQHVKELASQGRYRSQAIHPQNEETLPLITQKPVVQEQPRQEDEREKESEGGTENNNDTPEVGIIQEETLYASDFTMDNPEFHVASNALTILRLLRDHQQPLSIEEIQDLTSFPLQQVQEAMEYLYEQGDIYEADDGAWTVI